VVEGVLHTAAVGELHDAFTLALVVNVGVRDLAGRPEVVLQVLPRRLRRDVLDDNPVVGPRARRISTTASVAVAESATSSSSSAPWILGKLDTNAASFEVLSVKIVNGVIGIPVVFELDKAVAVFDDDVSDAAVALKELLHVTFPHVVRDVAHVDSLAGRHLGTS
jgi:hypothetical protein